MGEVHGTRAPSDTSERCEPAVPLSRGTGPDRLSWIGPSSFLFCWVDQFCLSFLMGIAVMILASFFLYCVGY